MENLFDPGDVLILVSASGKSPDLIKGVRARQTEAVPHHRADRL